MTIKLYDNDAYETHFTATVLSCEKCDKGYLVELDKTLFFPNEGGQSCDNGTINGIEVLDVNIKDGVITHLLTVEIDPESIVNGEIDFNHRFSNMQMHSGEHIFSGTVFNLYGYNNVGFHLSDNSATMDFDGKMSMEEVREVERLVNEAIFANKSISARYVDKDELKNIEYRSKKEIEGDIRLVTVEDIDVCACCAPHVRKTGEIGLFKVVSLENYKGGVRINYLCGRRALAYYNSCLDALKNISVTLSVKSGCELDAVKKLSADYSELKEVLNIKNSNLIDLYIDSLNDNKILVLPSEYVSHLRYAATKMLEKLPEPVFVFSGNDSEGYKYIIASDTINLSDVASALKDRLNAKGGGKPNYLQGSIDASIIAIQDTLKMFY